MYFNSIQYAFFLPAVFILNYIAAIYIRKPFITQIFLLACSLFFYACWKPAYLALIFLSVIITYLNAIFMERFPKIKKALLAFSLISNLGILFAFKYFNFFTAAINSSVKFNVLLPVGISFYTFQALGYTIDVYRKKLQPERNFAAYALFVTFFPQLVAGPIERAQNLLPQFKTVLPPTTEEIKAGLKLIVWGLFEKIVIADRLALYVNNVYSQLQPATGCAVLLSTFFFCFQVLCDFSGYSNIAIGSARILGFKLSRNFRSPFFSKSMSELWNRWHITLSSWFKDYVYIPLGGSRCGLLRHCLNLIIIMTLSGLWHGAGWHFVLWGFMHGLVLSAEALFRAAKKMPSAQAGTCNTGIKIFKIFATFTVFTLLAISFRADSVPDFLYALKKLTMIPSEISLAAKTLLRHPHHYPLTATINYLLFLHESIDISGIVTSLVLIAILMTVSFITRKTDGTTLITRCPLTIRWLCYYALIYALIFYSVTEKTQFVYFQF